MRSAPRPAEVVVVLVGVLGGVTLGAALVDPVAPWLAGRSAAERALLGLAAGLLPLPLLAVRRPRFVSPAGAYVLATASALLFTVVPGRGSDGVREALYREQAGWALVTGLPAYAVVLALVLHRARRRPAAPTTERERAVRARELRRRQQRRR